ncbi:MAG TPA: nucleotidyltransferase [Clostridiales bacterium]|nr:nucleotidyltransferase [Clostridiales bacterium]
MKIAGIIAEYNPFHNGHALHIQKTREFTGATHIICVMSGNFVQRGQPALLDKWARAKMALLGGADMVIELPFLYAAQSAEGFAAGGVRLLSALRCVEFLSFGSECADLSTLDRQAALLAREPKELTLRIKALLKEGLSYPGARGMAVAEHLGIPKESAPNDILAVEYLKAIRRYHADMRPVPVQRTGGGYHDNTLRPSLSSASAIRAAIASSGVSDAILSNIPPACHSCFHEFTPLTDFSAHFKLLLYRIRSMRPGEIANLHDVSEGLEHRIIDCAKNAETLEELILAVKSKRYPYTRIQRILLYIFAGVTRELVRHANESVPYARVLGFRQDASALLSEQSRRSAIPVLVRSSDFLQNKVLEHDFYASDLYALLHTHKNAPAGRDFRQPVITV